MNHNYYYTLLGRRAGGPGSAQVSDCSGSLQLRYAYDGQGGELVGAQGDSLQDWEGLVFGSIVEVWPSQPQLAIGVQLYLDSQKTQEISTVGREHFRIDTALFVYEVGVGITQITQISYPTDIQVFLNAPSPSACQLIGPYNQPVWVARDQWQQVDRIWLDQALTDPFVGGNNWYGIEDQVIPSGGTTLRVNNCGWVTGFFAC